jgi:hypothetical protein
MTRNRMILALASVAFFGAQAQAGTWYFEDTVIQGTFSGTATVTGFVSVTAANFGPPVSITLTGPFGTFTDNGSTLQLDEGNSGFADTYVDFILSQPLTPGLPVDPLTSFTFTSAFPGSTVTDTYSLVSGELVLPEPGTASAMLLGVAVLIGAARWRQRRLI